MPRAKAIPSTLLVVGPFLLLAACTNTKPMTDAGFSQAGSASYPNRVPQGTVSVTRVGP